MAPQYSSYSLDSVVFLLFFLGGGCTQLLSSFYDIFHFLVSTTFTLKVKGVGSWCA